ncbi:MAG: UPF0182 family protein [Bacillota bacterium]|nr:UPF0182 family protein [Bacillota bacterium]
MDRNSNSGMTKIVILLLILGGISLVSKYYIDWLWFSSLDFQNVFTITLLSKALLYVVVFVLAFIFFFLNLQITKKNIKQSPDRPEETDEGREIIYLHKEESRFGGLFQGKMGHWIFAIISLFGAFLVSSSVGDKWITVQQFINRIPFNVSDPVFNKDIAFYFFNLSFYQFIYTTVMTALVIAVVLVGVIYLMNATTELFMMEWKKFTFSKSHVAILLAAIFGLKAWGYRLGMYSILFSPSGIVFGATYTDMFARLLSYKVLMGVAILVAVMILVNIFIKRITWILYSVGAWVILATLLSGVYPAIMQKIVVQPNEFNKEKPYIERAIQYTRQAYNLDEVTTKQFDISYDLTTADIENNRPTIDNIRLWDWQPLKDTYKSLQELRLYYVFHNVDIDRYMVDGEYRQVMLSVREMEDMDRNEALDEQAKTWVNQRLMFTHGYGLAMSPVTETAQEGFPKFIIKDVPPVSNTDIEITKPEIYFGERTDSYVIVNTEQQEFDYPMGTQNVYTTYEGKNGIKINSFSRRLLLAWVLRDYKMILSSDISNDSQILMNRNIVDRIRMIAPYLGYDQDPYIVVNDDGRLYWMLDAYTYSDMYPYSKPFDRNGNNYLRNAVKVVCDAYTGEMNFYIADENDPIIKTYEKIFPGLYQPLEEMPEGLKSHIRYPVDMFTIQANMYKVFHMTEPWVFYNKEDSWVIPTEIVENNEEGMEPYYIITRLPGEEKEEYILMLPYIPNARPNLTAWMCARMDGDNYGKMLVYRFPKQETVYGPMQVESRIDQNTEISKQISLWNQTGSSTYRGNLLVIPIENSLLYIEPLYLQSETSKMPELKRVIASYQNQVVMEESLEEALIALFGVAEAVPTPTPPTDQGTQPPVGEESSLSELAVQARQLYDQADQALREGDWTGYGRNIDRLNKVIQRLEEVSNQ